MNNNSIWNLYATEDKTASILDYQKQSLCPEIWDYSKKLLPNVKEFVIKQIKAFFSSNDLRGYKEFISHIYIGSSLATYFYKEDSDFDVKIVINPEVFKQYNQMYTDQPDEDIMDELVEMGRTSIWLTAFIPGTMHPLDAYFFTDKESSATTLLKYDSLYNILTDTWIKEPKKVPGEVSPSYMLNYAKDKAKIYIDKIIDDLERAKRDTVDFLLLKEYLKNLEEDDLRGLAVDFKNSLETLNQDIEDLVQDKEIVKELRKKEFSRKDLKSHLEQLMGSLNYSDGNVIFKLIQRYGYLKILVEIAAMFKNKRVKSTDALDIYKILFNKKKND